MTYLLDVGGKLETRKKGGTLQLSPFIFTPIQCLLVVDYTPSNKNKRIMSEMMDLHIKLIMSSGDGIQTTLLESSAMPAGMTVCIMDVRGAGWHNE